MDIQLLIENIYNVNNFDGRVFRFVSPDYNKIASHRKSTIESAKQFVIDMTDSFDKYIWQFVNYKTIDNKIQTILDMPVKTIEAEKMSKDLLKKGFKFVGPTICYAFMQAVGMVNDHEISCFKK
jgi:3-methyladenine DNA glycosylase Tag